MVATAWLIPGLKVRSLFGAFVTVIAIAVLNATIWDPRLFYSLPQTFSSFALSLFFANGVIFWILVKVLPGIEVKGVFPALLAPCVFTLASVAIGHYAQNIDWMLWAENGAKGVAFLRDTFLQKKVITP